MINTVGSQYLTQNIENGEFSYAIALGGTNDLAVSNHYKIDLRFLDETSNTMGRLIGNLWKTTLNPFLFATPYSLSFIIIFSYGNQILFRR